MLPAVCFISCHIGASEQFVALAEALSKKGYPVAIFANGPGETPFRAKNMAMQTFSLDGPLDQAAFDLAEKCKSFSVVITDVGHPLDEMVHKALDKRQIEVLHAAYYDNLEPFVPGGYSKTAAKTMNAAERVLFANASLAKEPIYEEQEKETQINYLLHF